MGTPLLINAINMEAGHVPNDTTNDTLTTRIGYGSKMRAPLEAHLSAETTINANLSLSQQGRMEALKKVGTTVTAPGEKWMRKEISDLQEKDQRYRTQFFTIDSGMKEVAERMPTYVYLWSKLDSLDVSGRLTQFAQAAEADQVKVLAAMLENPFGPMIDEESKARVLTERAKQLFPKDYENFQQNALLLDFLVTFRDWIARWLAVEVGVPIDVIRTNFGDEIADTLTTQQVTGFPK